jgi:hypothetical protein
MRRCTALLSTMVAACVPFSLFSSLTLLFCPAAKRAFLTLVTTPPALLQPSTVEPYTGADVPSILSAVANRPRSRSIAGQGSVSGPSGGHGHSRKNSLLGSGGGSALGAAIASAQAAGPHGAATASTASPNGGVSPVSVSASHGHARTGSWQRSSISSPLSGIRSNGGAGSPVDELAGGRASPDAGNGVIAGEAPRRYGTGPVNGHARRGTSFSSLFLPPPFFPLSSSPFFLVPSLCRILLPC